MGAIAEYPQALPRLSAVDENYLRDFDGRVVGDVLKLSVLVAMRLAPLRSPRWVCLGGERTVVPLVSTLCQALSARVTSLLPFGDAGCLVSVRRS